MKKNFFWLASKTIRFNGNPTKVSGNNMKTTSCLNLSLSRKKLQLVEALTPSGYNLNSVENQAFIFQNFF